MPNATGWPPSMTGRRRPLPTGTPEQGPEEIEALQGRLRDLRLEQAEVQERIRRSSPRLGALESPTPLDLAAARAALDPGNRAPHLFRRRITKLSVRH